jgi:hypothetical protein
MPATPFLLKADQWRSEKASKASFRIPRKRLTLDCLPPAVIKNTNAKQNNSRYPSLLRFAGRLLVFSLLPKGYEPTRLVVTSGRCWSLSDGCDIFSFRHAETSDDSRSPSHLDRRMGSGKTSLAASWLIACDGRPPVLPTKHHPNNITFRICFFSKPFPQTSFHFFVFIFMPRGCTSAIQLVQQFTLESAQTFYASSFSTLTGVELQSPF